MSGSRVPNVLPEWKFNCYIANSLAAGDQEQTNSKIRDATKIMKKRGLTSWSYDPQLFSFFDCYMDAAAALRNSACVIVFLTETYWQSIQKLDTDAAREFQLLSLKGPGKIVLVALEPKMMGSEARSILETNSALMGASILDLSAEANFEENVSGLCDRIEELFQAPKLQLIAGRDFGDVGVKTTDENSPRGDDCLPVKLMFVGRGRAGKTSTVRSLFNNPFVSNLRSTVVAATTEVDIKVFKWDPKSKSNNPFLAKLKSTMVVATTEEDVKVFEWDPKSNGSTTKTTKKNLKLALWDLGGQTVFELMHMLFMTEGGVYVVVFDACSMINSHSREEELWTLNRWLDAISLSAPGSPVLTVGTKIAQVTKKDLSTISKDVKLLLENANIVAIESMDFAFFPLENSTIRDDPTNIQKLRAAISNVISSPEKYEIRNTPWINNTPLHWTAFMSDVCQKWKDRVSIKSLVEQGALNEIPEDEIHSILNSYAESGTILPLPSSRASPSESFIVLDTNWFFNMVGNFIYDPKLHGHFVRSIAGKKWKRELRKFEQTGVLSDPKARRLLETRGISDNNTMSFILDQCENMLVISRFIFGPSASTSAAEDLSEVRWLVPAMNRSESSSSSRPPAQRCFKVFIRWKSRLPFGIFERLICLFLERNGAIEGSNPPIIHSKQACFFLRSVPVFLTDHTPDADEFELNVQELGFGIHLPFIIKILNNILDELKRGLLEKHLNCDVIVESLEGANSGGQNYQCSLKSLLTARLQKKNFVFLANTYEVVPISFFAHFINPVTTPVQDEPRNAGEWKWDCFLAHEWGETTGTGYFETHHKVLRIAEMLRKAGLRVWVDDSYIRDQLSTEMADGILNSACIVTFLTQRYFLRCQDPNTNCARELHNAKLKGAKHLLPVVLDHRVLDTNQWLGTAVSMALPDKLYINFSNEKEISNNFENFCNEIKLRVQLPRKKVLLDLDETKA